MDLFIVIAAGIGKLQYLLTGLLIPVIKFGNFAMFFYRSDSPLVKQNLIYGITNSAYELPHELPNNLRLTILVK